MATPRPSLVRRVRRRSVTAFSLLSLLLVGACAPATPPGVSMPVEAYGPGELNEGQWWLPTGNDLPVVVLVHGGYWGAHYDRHLEDPVATHLAGLGYAVYNIDYRPAGNGDGTFTDVAAGIDFLPESEHAARLDLTRVAVVGHSAGGHLALWAGSRTQLPAGAPGADPRIIPSLVVAQAPVADLRSALRDGLGGGAVEALLGDALTLEGDSVFARTSPQEMLDADAPPSVVIHGDRDSVVPRIQSDNYVSAARAAGATSMLVEFHGDHFDHLKPDSAAIAALVTALGQL